MDGHLLWDYRVVLDLFLGGVGVGAFVLSSLFYFINRDENRELYKVGFLVSPFLVSLGLVFLLLEIGRPFNAAVTVFSVNPSSIMSIGVFLQALFLVISFYTAYAITKESAQKFLDYVIAIGCFGALATGLYHGMLLYGTGRDAWSGVIPVLFLASSLASGFVFTYLLAVFRGYNKNSLLLKSSIAIYLFIVLGGIFAWIYGLGATSEESKNALAFFGENYNVIFYLLALISGVIVPLLILFAKMKSGENISKQLLAISAVMILIGSFVLKYVVVYIGQIEFMAKI